MKGILLLFFVLVAPINLKSQELNGVWVSSDNLITKTPNSSISQDGVSIINFDREIMNSLNNESQYRTVALNKKETKIKIKGIKGKLKVYKSGNGVLVLEGKNNTRFTFKKLDGDYEFNLNTKDISNFILNQHCGIIQDIQAEFKKEQFFIDKKSNKPINRFQVINYSKRDNGYWYIKKINKYVLLVFTTEQNKSENIFQLISLDLKGFKINQLYSDGHINNLKSIKICL